MRNEQLNDNILKILEHQAEFKSEITNIKLTLHEIKAVDVKQFEELEQIRIEKVKQNGRLGKLEQRVDDQEKINDQQHEEIKSGSMQAFWEKNWRWIMFLAMAILGFKDNILSIIPNL